MIDAKVKRNDPCPCGSGKKHKKCCLDKQPPDQSVSWADDDGIHFVGAGAAPSAEELEQMTREYQKKIRKSPLWNEMVKKYGKAQAEELLKQFKAEIR